MTDLKCIANHYQFDPAADLIGQGGMGAVYRGLDLQTGRPVAVKLLKPEVIADAPGLVERFVREADTLRRLNHPHIVRILATVDEDGHHYIVMEYVGGGSLHRLMVKQPQMPVARVLQIGLEVADALARAHHLKIIHRDIKPANILLADDGTTRLSDFGIARLNDYAITRLTQAGELVGTYAYSPPEGLHGRELDGRADIWSLGVTLFEMLAGRRPFETGRPTDLMMAILNDPPPDLERIRPDAPVALVDLIYRMLEKDPDRRISSARLVGAELEAIIQGVDTAHRPLKRLSTSPPTATPTPSPLSLHNLPPQTTPFVGRERELADIAARLDSLDCRLLTLVGPGGIGKTRLALQAASQRIGHYAHGVYYVPLASVSEPALLVPTIADAIKLNFSGSADPGVQLIDHLRTRHLLLALDSFEHLTGGADLLARILDTSPEVKLLVTSRQNLNLQGEWLYEVWGMPFPEDDPGSLRPDEPLEQFSAFQLFMHGAYRVSPGFNPTEDDRRAIARICQLVRGMPLGIELASAWVRMLSCEEIASEIEQNLDFLATTMRDVPERHRSMRAVCEYSWNSLSDEERQAFKRLSVFRGSFHRDAVRHITGAALLTLSALVNKSLLHRTPAGRYEVHSLLRQYALRKLEESPEEWDDVHHRHSDYYAEFLFGREAQLTSSYQTEAIKELAQEIQDLRAAFEWAVERSKIDKIGMSLRGMFLFYDIRSWFAEGESLLNRVVQKLTGLPPTAERDGVLGRALRYQGMFFHSLARYDRARAIFQSSVALFRAIGDKHEMAFTLNQIGSVSYATADYADARRYYEETIHLYREIGAEEDVTTPLMHLGDIATVLGDYAEAKRCFADALPLIKKTGTPRSTALCLAQMGDTACKLGEYTAARQYFEEARRLSEEVGDRRGIGIALVNLGRVSRALGEYPQAIQQCRDSLSICEAAGNRWGASFALAHLGAVYAALGDYQEASRLFRESLSICREIGNRWVLAFTLQQLGHADFELEHYGEARRNFVYALSVAREIKAVPLVLGAALGMARMLLQAGDRQTALPLINLILHHPITEYEVRQQARAMLATFPYEVIAALDKQETPSLETVVETLLMPI